MREKDFQIKFGNYIHEKWDNRSAAFELKVTKTDSILLSKFKQHQLMSLLAAKRRKLFYKIPDSEFSGFKPFDCFVLVNSEAYAVIKFKSGVVMVDIETLLKKQKWSYEDALWWGKKIW